jgi:putative DNA primase/helicase
VLVAGEGGLGKSMLLAWIAAAVSRGKEWPCGEGQSRRGSVIILSAEDDAADTIVPRLMAADADCTKVHILETIRKDDEGHRTFNLQLDLPELEKTIDRLDDVRLVIIDPITSYLGKSIATRTPTFVPCSSLSARWRQSGMSRSLPIPIYRRPQGEAQTVA